MFDKTISVEFKILLQFKLLLLLFSFQKEPKLIFSPKNPVLILSLILILFQLFNFDYFLLLNLGLVFLFLYFFVVFF